MRERWLPVRTTEAPAVNKVQKAERVQTLARRLKVERTLNAIRYYRSGGVRSAGGGTRSGGSEGYALQHDPTDARGYRDEKRIGLLLDQALDALTGLAGITAEWCQHAELIADPPAAHCENPECPTVIDVLEARPRTVTVAGKTYAVCEKCRKHVWKHGRLWPIRANGTRVRKVDSDYGG